MTGQMPYVTYLKDLKKSRNLTVAEIAELSKIPASTISRIFSGNTMNASFETISPIVIAMGGSLDEMVGLKSPDEEPVKPQVETTLNAYADLLNEKDMRIREKDKTIEILTNTLTKERREKNRLAVMALILVAVLAALVAFDLANGHLGIFRY